MSEPVWVGIDLGTQSVRAVAVTAAGAVRGSGSAPLTGRRDGPRHEQDPADWWRAVVTACRAALAGIPPAAVRGVAVDGTSGTVLLTDANGRPLTPALMYDDTRAAGEVERINEAGAELWAALGYRRMQPAWALPKLLWLLREYDVPDGARLAHQTDVITRRLTGHAVATDLSTALKTGADLLAERWPDTIMDALGVPAGLLPPLVRPGTRLGTVTGTETGLPEGTPVIAGMTDGCASQLATGRLEPGSWNSVLGTTLVLKGVTAEPVRDSAGVVYSHRSPDGGWLPGGASSTGAGAISRDFPGRDLAALDAAAAAYEPAGVLAYPLTGAGERFPFVAPDARGFRLGEPGGEAEHFAALLQGIAYVERLCFDYLRMLGAPTDGALTLTGGAARSRYWSQLRADVLGRPVEVLEDTEPAAGMAILAAAADRPGRVAAVAAEMGPAATTIEPRATHAGRFDAGYLRLVGELARRGWLPEAVAAHIGEGTRP